MAWLLAHEAEIVNGSHQPLAEMVLPEPVDQDPRQERIGTRIDHLSGEFEPAAAVGDARLAGATEDFEKPPGDRRARIAVIAADQDRLIFPRAIGDRRGQHWIGNCRFDRPILGQRRLEPNRQRLAADLECGEHRFKLDRGRLRSLAGGLGEAGRMYESRR